METTEYIIIISCFITITIIIIVDAVVVVVVRYNTELVINMLSILR